MTIYKVYHYPHVLLKKTCTPVEKFTPQLKEFIENLVLTAKEFEGGGIAAPQVGVCKRVFVSDFTHAFDQKEDSEFAKKENDFIVYNEKGEEIPYKFPMAFVNPVILETAQPIETNWEGCLSFPNVDSYTIPRFREVTVEAQNEHGEKFRVKTTHLYAAVNFLHEIDHLNGVLMINHWQKQSYQEKYVVADIKDHEDDPKERKKIKKLKLVDAAKIAFDFV